jgi:hypothetical protein
MAFSSWPSGGFAAACWVGRVAADDHPLMGLLLVQSSVRPAGIAHMGFAIPLRRYLSDRPGGFPSRPSRMDGLESTNAPLVEFSGPPGSCTHDTSPGPRTGTPPLGFPPLRHMQTARSGSHGRCLPATFRPQGLATLPTVSSLADLADHVSGRQRPWGFPFGVCPRPESPGIPADARPACRYHWADQLVPKPEPPSPNGPASGNVPGRVPCGRSGYLARATAGNSLGVPPSQGLFTPA